MFCTHDQSGCSASSAVAQTERGNVAKGTDDYLHSLKRPIQDGGKAVDLFARNLESDIFNQSQLESLEGDCKFCKAKVN